MAVVFPSPPAAAHLIVSLPRAKKVGLMSYVIKEGRRTVAMKVSYAAWWGVCWAHIFVDCPTCDQSIGLKFDSNESADAFSNQEFLQIVRSKDWAIIPNKHIACPACRKGKGQANKASSRLVTTSRKSSRKGGSKPKVSQPA